MTVALTIRVPGRAVPMGSRSAVQRRGGKAWTFPQQSRALRAWQHAVACAARLALPGWHTTEDGFVLRQSPPDRWPTDWAYRVHVFACIAAPKSAPLRRGPHTSKPDASKLLRAIEDALTTAGVWHDDAQAFDARCEKHWSATNETTITVEAVRLEDRCP